MNAFLKAMFPWLKPQHSSRAWADARIETNYRRYILHRRTVLTLSLVLSAMLFVLSGAQAAASILVDDLLTGALISLDAMPVRYVHSWEALIPVMLGLTFCAWKSPMVQRWISRHFFSSLFASEDEIHYMRLDAKESGVVLGVNPYTGKVMMSNDDAHVLVVGPTRAGKSVNTVLPTAFAWGRSAFFLDLKGEIYAATAKYRERVLHQKVLRFEPLSPSSQVSWNPLRCIRFGTEFEMFDAQHLADAMIPPEKDSKDPYWTDSARDLLVCFILHAYYVARQQGRDHTSIRDVLTYVAPGQGQIESMQQLRKYQHITFEEFLKPQNIFEKMYGAYIQDFSAINSYWKTNITSMKELKEEMRRRGENCVYVDDDWEDSEGAAQIAGLLTHPKVHAIANAGANNAENTEGCIFSELQSIVALYANPILQDNMEDSDFDVADLLADGKEKTSLYLVVQPKDIPVLRPFLNFFVEYFLRQTLDNSCLCRDEYYPAPTMWERLRGLQPCPWREPRLLILLDDFTQLGRIGVLEDFITICAGYGVKLCLVTQDLFQIDRSYTTQNCIPANCNISLYFTPNMDLGMRTAKTLADITGLTPYYISKMPKNAALVVTPGERPVLGEKITYRDHARFGFKEDAA